MTLEQAIQNVLKDGQLSCAAAFRISRARRCSPGEVGDMANHLDIRISHCQLGLFGYGPKAQGLHKVVQAAETVSAELEGALKSRAHDGKISCADLWAIAKRLSIPKMEACAAAEALELHVTQCQLHCF